MSKEITEEQIKEIVKYKDRGAPPPQVKDEFESQDERQAYASKTLTNMLDLLNVPIVKTAEEYEERTALYFQRCASLGVRPLWEEYCLALGTTKQCLWNWANGVRRGPVAPEVVTRAKDFIAAYDARMVTDGKMNPVTYIFRAKNYYGMKDQQDVVVTPNTNEGRPRDELIKEAMMLPED